MNPRTTTRTVVDTASHPRRGRPALTLSAALAVGAVTLAACGGGGGGADSGDTAERSSLTIGVQGNWPPINAVEVASEMGFFDKQNLDVKFVTLQNAPAGITGLVGGSLDATVTAADWVQAPIKGQKDLVGVASTLNVAPFKLVANADIKSWTDVKGKTIGVVSPYGVSTVALMQALREAGVQSSDVKTVAAGNTSSRFNAVLENKVDAASVAPPFDLRATEEGLTNLGVGPSADDPPKIVTASITVRKSWADGDEGSVALDRMLRGLLAFTKHAYDPANTEEVAKATARVMDIDVKYTKPVWDEILAKKWLPKDLKIARANIESYLEGYEELGGKLPADVTSDRAKYVDSLVDDSYLERAAGAK